MAQIRAIVFDSNVFGAGATPDIDLMRRWVDACDANEAELWIPEVVAHELAQHAVETHEGFATKHAAHLRRLQRWGQPAGAPLPAVDVAAIVSAIRRTGAVIVPVDGEAAREALWDQVLQRGVGARKQGVKTGAADSAWVRSVVDYNDYDTEGLIVVTGDRTAVERTCKQIGVRVPRVVRHLGQVADLLESSSPADEAWTAKFRHWAEEYFVGDQDPMHERGPSLADLADLGPFNWWTIEDPFDEGYAGWELQDRTVGPIFAIKILGAVEHDAWTDTLTATVRLTSEVEEQYARQDSFGEFVQYRSRVYPGSAQAGLRLTVEGDELAFDGVLEDLQLLPATAADISWDPM